MVVWTPFVNLFPTLILFLAVYDAAVVRRHRHRALREFNRLSAAVLHTLVALPI